MINPPEITYRRILRLYLPLALSWLFMALEAPICAKLLAGIPADFSQEVALAAFNALMAYSLFIESPVIDLLATSTTLAKDPVRRAHLSYFSLLVMTVSTVVHAFVCLPPVFNFVTGHLHQQVRDALYWPFVVMIPWSAFIGWRRFRQGLLIQAHRSGSVGIGTIVRFLTLSGTGYALYTSQLSPVMVTAVALVVSVAAEALFAHLASMPLATKFHVRGFDWASLRSIAKFHTPLSLTTMVNIVGLPIITSVLAVQPNSIMNMAAWQTSLSLIWLHRTVIYAIPEVVITLAHDKESERKLGYFALTMGLLMSGSILVLHISGLDAVFFGTVLSANRDLVLAATFVFSCQVLTPLLSAGQSFTRGLLTARHNTVARLWATGIGFFCLVSTLLGGMALHIPPLSGCIAALYASLGMEVLFLFFALWKTRRTIA